MSSKGGIQLLSKNTVSVALGFLGEQNKLSLLMKVTF